MFAFCRPTNSFNSLHDGADPAARSQLGLDQIGVALRMTMVAGCASALLLAVMVDAE
jgi:hypothetical protein